MVKLLKKMKALVNCHVGSLEKYRLKTGRFNSVNCRVGSLESSFVADELVTLVNCRVGSLEYIDIVQNK